MSRPPHSAVRYEELGSVRLAWGENNREALRGSTDAI